MTSQFLGDETGLEIRALFEFNFVRMSDFRIFCSCASKTSRIGLPMRIIRSVFKPSARRCS